jgi:hypothetical protein
MTTFNFVKDISERDGVSCLEDNVKSFLDWSFLNIGGFINVNIPSSGIVGGDFSKLKAVADPGTQTNKVWESPRKDWVYESGVSHNGVSPNSISGLYLNNTFLPAPTGSGAYGYSVDYNLGRVTFRNPVSSNSSVNLSYSYRYVQTYKANESIWWKEIQENSYNPSNFRTNPDTFITSNHRVQLPAIVIQTAPRSVSIPYEIGTAANILIQDLLLHIYTENPTTRNSLIDILLKQKDKSLNLYDTNKVIKHNAQPLNYRGEPNINRLNYDQISLDNRFFLKKAFIQNSILSELNSFSDSLYHGVVRWSIEILP